MQRRLRACCTFYFMNFLAACGLLLYLAPACAFAADSSDRLELAVKAAFVYKFQIYVTWPASAFSSANAPFLLCIVGATPSADLIERAVRGQAHDGHPIVIRRLAALTADSLCHEAVIGPPDPAFIRAQMKAASAFDTLVITDTPTPAGGVINFVIADDTVRFAIDEAAAERLHLSVSSKLLRLAIAATEG